MKTFRLGASDIDVSAICLGCMEFGTRIGKEAAFAVLDAYYEQGGRFLDTSNNYAFWDGQGGESEALLGEWMRLRGNRKNLILATKFGAQPTVPGTGIETAEGLGRAAMAAAVEGSLKRLGVECIDLYYAHIEDGNTPVEETLGAFADLRRAGKIREIGCSNPELPRLQEARRLSRANGWPLYQCIQQRYSFLQPKADADFGVQKLITPEIKQYALDEDVSLIAYGTLRVGVAPGSPLLPEYDTAENRQRLRTLIEVARRYDRTPGEVVMAWMINSRPNVIPITSTKDVNRLLENLGSLSLVLDRETLGQLDDAGWNP